MLIASPSDLRDERDRVERILHRWNDLHSEHERIVLLPVRWETNASAEMGTPAQDVINRQIVDGSDILVGMFWTRLGTPTATNVSGTAEELQRFVDAGKPAALFMCRRPAALDTVDQDQWAALTGFLDAQRETGLVLDFETPEELAGLVERSATRFVRERWGDLPAPTVVARPAAVAHVRAEHLGFSSDHWVVLQNIGAAEARQITLECRAASGGDEGSWDLLDSDEPIDFLPQEPAIGSVLRSIWAARPASLAPSDG